MKKVLVVAVHPDDETLGCGGTLLRHKAEGDEIHWLIMTNVFEEDGWSKDFIEKRKRQVKKIASLFSFKTTTNLNYPTTKLEEFPRSQVLKGVSEVLEKVQPQIVYLPFKGDVHSEHGYTFEIVYSCTKVFRYPFVSKILCMETLSETDFAVPTADNLFVPNSFVDITGYLDQKLEALKIYESEMGEHPFPRSTESIRALATLRGVQGGVKAAECFMLIKSIE